REFISSLLQRNYRISASRRQGPRDACSNSESAKDRSRWVAPANGNAIPQIALAARSEAPSIDHLDALEAQSIYILREAFARLKKLALLWSLGKDSNVMI